MSHHHTYCLTKVEPKQNLKLLERHCGRFQVGKLCPLADLQGYKVARETNPVQMRVNDPERDPKTLRRCDDFQFLPSDPFYSSSKANAFSLSTVTTILFYKNLQSPQNLSPPSPRSFGNCMEEGKKKKSNNAFVTVNSSHAAVTCAAPMKAIGLVSGFLKSKRSPTAEAVFFFHTTFVAAAVALTQLFSVGIQIKED